MDNVTLVVADGVGTISLNRPHRHNAIDDDTHEELEQAWQRAAADDAARVIVLRGEGPSFCSGRDTAQLGERVAGESDLAFVRRHQRARIAQLDSPKPVIAAVRGYALGGGLEMALAADIRIGATDVRMAFPEIRYGLMTDTGGSPLATLLAGPSRAKWLLMTGRQIDATVALGWGLLDEVVAPEELDGRVAELAREIAGKPPGALAMIKQTVDGMGRGPLRAALDAELLGQVALFAGADYQERKRARTEGAR
ncbi:enoyl-CoA hydratase/isomerase family protein [Amycolatopsis acidiphila]|uniref:Enoyl-CoA hydratase/isomerase family protein n=1 Tax=Amycolatopsis acidiphila TaxID=715473 RepID=A0A558AB02_9PSEU|nr:enoyl-CoA hydratase/isomerase family protein [Amycolatopsis acidiphila]TVT21446.1 enoyl-CoA hydratase/isomerase family protein [Amycolatopsis acidiphila]UIJ63120.1 enoyl-CoA hydratase/isomerase family protein [Amycolatopsis acidiphila]GHG73837.1 enoyl-CoA hydratase [Amycolatopsis acidiphila]